MGRGFAMFAGTPPEIIQASAREAEALGFSSFWVNHPGSIDGVAALALAAAQTRTIELGIGVIPLHTHGPDRIMQDVRRHALPLPRLLLGVGSANPGGLRRVREGIATLRANLSVRLVAAALGPQMCRLGGEIADAVLLNWLTPAHARRSAEWVAAGAAAAGRARPKLFAYVRTALGAAAREKLLAEGARYAAIPAYAASFARMGAAPIDTAISARTPEDIPRALEQWEGAVDEIVLRAITSEETIKEYAALLRAAKP